VKLALSNINQELVSCLCVATVFYISYMVFLYKTNQYELYWLEMSDLFVEITVRIH
jgi:hypothetical protein